MLRVVLKRLAWCVPLLFLMSFFSFVLVSLVPGDAARVILGENARPEQLAALRQELGLNDSLFQQYWSWLEGLLHGSLGTSVFTGEAVTSILEARLEASLLLVTVATLAAALTGVALGTLSALRGGWLGRALDALSQLGLALPNFWLSLVLIALFAVTIELFPATGYVPIAEDPFEWARSMVLPVLALGFVAVAVIAKQMRDSMLDALGAEYVRTLQANGFSRRSVVLKHAMRNASPPVLAATGVVFVNLLGGTILIESIFAIPGLGQVAVQATADHDVPVVQGTILYFTLMVVAVNLIIDVVNSLLDPRVRTS